MSTINAAVRQLSSALLSLMKQKSIHQIKVTELCDAAGIARSTFYLYFDSVYAALQEIEDRFFESLPSTNTPNKSVRDSSWSDRATVLAFSTVRFIRENRDALKTLLGPNGDPMFERRLYDRYYTAISLDFQKTDKAFLSPLEKELRCSYMAHGMLGLLKWWCVNGDSCDINEYTSLVKKIFFAQL